MRKKSGESVPLKFEHLFRTKLTIQPYLNQKRPPPIVKIIYLDIICILISLGSGELLLLLLTKISNLVASNLIANSTSLSPCRKT